MRFFINKILIAIVLLWLSYGFYVFYDKTVKLKRSTEDDEDENADSWSDF